MGIKHLWSVLTPFCDRKPLYELSGKTVAVDLSCWICEAQNIAEYQVQPRMYLRNLYFRTCFLLLMEVIPVFVLEGKAPELKYDTIAARNEQQFKGSKPKKDGVKTGKGRTRFHFVLKQCEDMLGFMGLACITGKGEAESLCAYLNDEGLVDGCISQDSDCFAYGAKVVYRNFSISTQGAFAASGGAVDIYDITRATKALNFGRNKIIAMALLCGSDYSEGVLGIGKESVIKFFEKLPDAETLDRIRSWRREPDLYEKYQDQISNKNICTSCGHSGKIQMHTKNGCHSCKTTKGCDPFKFKEERLSIKNELAMRSKALQDPNFPDENLINEFLVKKDKVSKLNLKWKQPDVVSFVKFTNKFLGWEEIYAFEKILPILTRWQCINRCSPRMESILKGAVVPDRIKKVRNPKGIPSYLIVWTDPNEYFKGLIPDQQLLENNTDPEKLWSTVEPKVLVDEAYPDLVEIFESSKKKPKKKETKRTNKDGPPTKKARKEREKNNDKCDGNEDGIARKPKKKQVDLDNFLRKAVLNSQKWKNTKINVQDKPKTSTPMKMISSNSTFISDISDFGDEEDLDLSGIVLDIMAKKPDYMQTSLQDCNIEISLEDSLEELANASSFFITNPVENDLFEQTFNMMYESDSSEETDENDRVGTDNNKQKSNEAGMSINGAISENIDAEIVIDDSEIDVKTNEDSFDIVCEPLLDRVKRKIKQIQ